jgi:hypothetical protein
MKTTSKFWISGKFLVPALLAGMLLSACGEKEPEAPAEVAPATEAAPAEPAPAPEPAPAAAGPGGYVPSAEELVPGVTISQEELDKRNAELLKDTPKPVIPGEAPAAPAAEVAPATEAK